MTIKQKQAIYDLVGVICGTTVYYDIEKKCYISQKELHDQDTADVPTEKSWDAAMEILKIAGVTSNANIVEIPLCWAHQVSIRFTIGETFGEAHEIFDLSAGISSKDPSKFFFDLCIEDFDGRFPAPADDDMGFYLFRDYWKIENGCVIA